MSRLKKTTSEIVDPENWFELLAQRPIIVCGASLSSAEFDIWHSILCRYRMNKPQPPMFKMFGCSERPETKEGYINHFDPITEDKLSFKDEWQMLQKMLAE